MELLLINKLSPLITKRDKNRKPGRYRSLEYKYMIGEKSNHRCVHCGVDMVYEGPQVPTSFTYEHVVPICYGSTWELDNLYGACLECNHRGGTQSGQEATRRLLLEHGICLCYNEESDIARADAMYRLHFEDRIAA